MLNPIKRIVTFNRDAGLLDKPYSDNLECSFIVEEALEGFGNLHILAAALGTESSDPKQLSRAIIGVAQGSDPAELSDVVRLDKACDAIVYAVGSIAKLGLNAQQITQALNIVMDSNLDKLKSKTYDAEGKLLKDPATFVGPEPRLQALLDKRS